MFIFTEEQKQNELGKSASEEIPGIQKKKRSKGKRTSSTKSVQSRSKRSSEQVGCKLTVVLTEFMVWSIEHIFTIIMVMHHAVARLCLCGCVLSVNTKECHQMACVHSRGKRTEVYR